MEYLQPYIYNIVRGLIKDRSDAKKFPYVATHNDVIRRVQADIQATIAEMEADGVIAHNININGIYLYRLQQEMNPEKSTEQ